jgi:hypothetical protein
MLYLFKNQRTVDPWCVAAILPGVLTDIFSVATTCRVSPCSSVKVYAV